MKREEIICFRFTGEELQRINERMKELGIQNRSAYIRKMVMEGYCIHLDLKDIRQLIYLLWQDLGGGKRNSRGALCGAVIPHRHPCNHQIALFY